MTNRRRLMAGAAAGVLLAGGGALAQSPPIVGISTVSTYFADARIVAVDPTARTATLAYSNGATATRKVGSVVASFSSTRVGDNVSVGFEDKSTFVLSGPNARTPADRDVNVTAAASLGQSGAGVATDQTIANWWVVDVDPAAGTLSLVVVAITTK